MLHFLGRRRNRTSSLNTAIEDEDDARKRIVENLEQSSLCLYTNPENENFDDSNEEKVFNFKL